jgi:hypothetical protein
MPTTLPDSETSGPPLLPALIGALVWMAFFNVVGVVPEVPISSTVRLPPEMMP